MSSKSLYVRPADVNNHVVRKENGKLLCTHRYGEVLPLTIKQKNNAYVNMQRQNNISKVELFRDLRVMVDAMYIAADAMDAYTNSMST